MAVNTRFGSQCSGYRGAQGSSGVSELTKFRLLRDVNASPVRQQM